MGPPFDLFLEAAEAVAEARPEVDAEMAREVFHEAATLLDNGLVLDGLDEDDARAVVTSVAQEFTDALSHGALPTKGSIEAFRPQD